MSNCVKDCLRNVLSILETVSLQMACRVLEVLLEVFKLYKRPYVQYLNKVPNCITCGDSLGVQTVLELLWEMLKLY